MATKIIIEIPGTFSDEETADLRYLLADAFGEFVSRRSPAELYVMKRYTENGVAAFSSKGMHDKMLQVKRRLALAEKLLHGAHDFKLEDIS